MAKRVRPRPNQVTIDMSAETRTKLNECVARCRETQGPFFSATKLFHDLIHEFHAAMPKRKNQNNFQN